MSQQNDQPNRTPSSAALELGDGAVFSGQVTSFDGDIIELEFSLAEAPVVALGKVIVLRLQLNPASPELRIPVFAIARGDDESQRRYTLQPRRKHDLSRLTRGYQRAYVRVPPRPEAPIQVDLCDLAGKPLVSGSALDISVAGVGVLLEASEELHLTSHDRIELAIQLPDGEPPRIMRGWIRSRRLVGTSVHLGIKLELGQSQAFRDAVQALTRYVRQRLVEMAKGERRIALSDLGNEAAA